MDTAQTTGAGMPAHSVPVYRRIALMVQSRQNCLTLGNTEWFEKWSHQLTTLATTLPAGSGIDHGTQIDLDKSNRDKLVLTMDFHHMDEYGGYDGWTSHTITVRPSFQGIDLTISGANRNNIKEYLHDVYYFALMEMA